MSDVTTCLQTVIGLSRNDCACFETDRPAAYNTSDSGLFLDDPEIGFPLSFTGTTEDCGEGNLWELMERARDDGVIQFITDLNGKIMDSHYRQRVTPFFGYLADARKINGLHSVTKQYAGVYYRPKVWKGVKVKVHGFELYMHNANGQSFTVNLVDQYGTSYMSEAVTISGTKGTVDLDPVVEIDLTKNGFDWVDLFFYYDRNGYSPRNSRFYCGCGGGDPEWYKFMQGYGFETDDLTDFDYAENMTKGTTYSKGLRPRVSLSCGSDWLCQEWDFVNDTWARVMAECILLYSVRKLTGYMLTSNHLRPKELLEGEALQDKINAINETLAMRMGWLTGNLPDSSTHCWECEPRIAKRPLLV